MKLKYELDQAVVEFILTALNRVQFATEQSARDLISVVDTLRSPINGQEVLDEQVKPAEEVKE